MLRVRLALLFLFSLAGAARFVAGDQTGAEPSLLQIQKILAGKKLVDLTHAFAPGIPHWPGFPDEKRETIYWYEKGRGTLGAGFPARVFAICPQ